MYIKSVELINVRSYKSEIIEFSKGINLLIGKNNSGKTTILKSLYKLQNINTLNESDVRKTTRFFDIYIKLVDVDENNKLLFFNKDEKDLLPKSDKQTIVFNSTLSNKYSFYLESNHTFRKLTNNHFQVFNQNSEQVEPNPFIGFPDREDKNNFIYPFFSKRKRDYYNERGGRSEIYRVSDDFNNLPSKIKKISSPSHPKSSEFNKYCDEILGFRVGSIPTDSDGNQNDRIGVFITDTLTVPVESMGDGVVNIVGLITMLLSENSKLYLIEELENDIHPEALKKLLNLIIEKSTNNQFVVSTHSNIVLKYLGSLPETKIFETSWSPKDNDSNEKMEIPTSRIEEIENTTQERLTLLESLGYDLFDFDLYKSYIITEESSAEKVIRDYIIPIFFPHIYNKVRTIAAKGADDLQPKYNDLHRLFLFTHSEPVYKDKVWVLADGDDAGKRNISKLKSDFKNSWTEDHFLNLKKASFEEYYPECFKEEVKLILAIEDNRKRQDAKGKLAEKVVELGIREKFSKNEFEQSAKEVIKILENILSKSLQITHRIKRMKEKRNIVLIIGAGASHDLHPEFGLGSHLLQHISDRVTDRTSSHNRYLSNLLLNLEGINSSVCWDFLHHLEEYRSKVESPSIDEFLNEVDTYPEFTVVKSTFMDIGYFSILFHILGYEGALKRGLEEDKKAGRQKETWVDVLAKFIDERGILNPQSSNYILKIITFNYDRNVEHLLFNHQRFQSDEKKKQISTFIDNSILHVYGKAGDLEWQNNSEHFTYGEDNNDWGKIHENKEALRIMYISRLTDELKKALLWLHDKPPPYNLKVFTFGFNWDMLNYNILKLGKLNRDDYDLIANIHPYGDDSFKYRRAMATKIRSVVPKAEFRYLSCTEFLNEVL